MFTVYKPTENWIQKRSCKQEMVVRGKLEIFTFQKPKMIYKSETKSLHNNK